MRRLIITGLVLAASLAATAQAQAAPIRECGGDRYWSIANVTTRGSLPCSDARRIARWFGYVEPYNHTEHFAPFWTCRVRGPQGRSWLMDVRCTHRANVVRWQYTGAGE
jgi:hypothetical protein